MAALSTPETLEYGAVGVPTSSVEVKLVDVPEMGYLTFEQTIHKGRSGFADLPLQWDTMRIQKRRTSRLLQTDGSRQEMSDNGNLQEH